MNLARTSGPTLRRVLASLAPLALLSCVSIGEMLAPTYDMVVIDQRPDPLYEEFSPHYAELCAVSQFRPKEGTPGGIPGHGVMYLKGACLDPNADYPRLIPCPKNVLDHRDPQHGTGISVNKEFKNINWVGVPGKKLFFHGNLQRGTLLDERHFGETVSAALPYFRNVQTHSYDDVEEFVRKESIGTDFALRFGRSLHCARMPLTAQMMGEVMGFLNDLNAEYFSGDQDYNWHGFHDNCVHTLRNALAAAKVWKPKKIWTIKLRQFFNLAIPANEVVELGALGTEYPLENFPKIYSDDLKRATLLDQDWLPMGPGVLMKSMSIHLRNDLYDTRYRLMIVESPFFAGVSKRAEEMLNDARFVELEPNLRYYRERYTEILQNWSEDLKWWEPRSGEYRNARRHYREYIGEQLLAVNQYLAVMNEQSGDY
jgi:hypothetical protein